MISNEMFAQTQSVQKMEVKEYEFVWEIPDFRLLQSHSKKFELPFGDRKISMIVDLLKIKHSEYKENKQRIFGGVIPSVYFESVPSGFCFDFFICTSHAGVQNMIEESVLVAKKPFSVLLDHFVNSKNVSRCMKGSNDIKFYIEVNIKKQPKASINSTMNLAVDMKNLYENKRFSDFTFIVDGKEMKAHKAVLAARSREFRKVFIDNAKESELTITDISKDTFAQLLRFVYCGSIENIKNNALELLKAADRFQIGGLKKICEVQLMESINEESAGEVFKIAHRMNATPLIKAAFEKIQQTFAVAVLKVDNKYIDEPETIGYVIQMMKDIKQKLGMDGSVWDPANKTPEKKFDAPPQMKLTITDVPVHAPKLPTPESEKKVKFAEHDEVKIIEDDTTESSEDGASTTSSVEEEPKERPLLDSFRKFCDEKM